MGEEEHRIRKEEFLMLTVLSIIIKVLSVLAATALGTYWWINKPNMK
jgi:hypothetical protein